MFFFLSIFSGFASSAFLLLKSLSTSLLYPLPVSSVLWTPTTPNATLCVWCVSDTLNAFVMNVSSPGRALRRHPFREVVWAAPRGCRAAQRGCGCGDGQPSHEWAPLWAVRQRGHWWKSPAAGDEWGPFCAHAAPVGVGRHNRHQTPGGVSPALASGPRSVNDPPVSCVHCLTTGATRHCIITTETNEKFRVKSCQEFHFTALFSYEVASIILPVCFKKRLVAC